MTTADGPILRSIAETDRAQGALRHGADLDNWQASGLALIADSLNQHADGVFEDINAKLGYLCDLLEAAFPIAAAKVAQ